MKKILSTVLSLLLLLSPASFSFADTTQVDKLINKLVEKGILTQQEASTLKQEMVEDEKIVHAEAVKQELPGWVKNTKLKGDFRLRYQYEKKENSEEARNRGRIRYRLGIESEVNDTVTVGAGLASGGSDPRSTNQTLENTFDTPDIRLDYAYANWEPVKEISIVGGKFARKNFLWAPTDLLWDGDINPEGGSIHLEKDLVKNIKTFGNTGVWVMDESSGDGTDPFLFYVQSGLDWKDGFLDSKLAAAYYGFNGIQGKELNNTACVNTGLSGSASNCSGALTYDYNAFGGSAEVGIKNPFDLPIERLAVFTDFVHNFDPDELENGWATGIKFGDKKVKGKGQWQVKYQYSYLGRDAFPDVFPDSDRYAGETDTKGHEVALEYGLNKNVILGLDYYHDQKIKAAKNAQDLIQLDLNYKF